MAENKLTLLSIIFIMLSFSGINYGKESAQLEMVKKHKSAQFQKTNYDVDTLYKGPLYKKNMKLITDVELSERQVRLYAKGFKNKYLTSEFYYELSKCTKKNPDSPMYLVFYKTLRKPGVPQPLQLLDFPKHMDYYTQKFFVEGISFINEKSGEICNIDIEIYPERTAKFPKKPDFLTRDQLELLANDLPLTMTYNIFARLTVRSDDVHKYKQYKKLTINLEKFLKSDAIREGRSIYLGTFARDSILQKKYSKAVHHTFGHPIWEGKEKVFMKGISELKEIILSYQNHYPKLYGIKKEVDLLYSKERLNRLFSPKKDQFLTTQNFKSINSKWIKKNKNKVILKEVLSSLNTQGV